LTRTELDQWIDRLGFREFFLEEYKHALKSAHKQGKPLAYFTSVAMGRTPLDPNFFIILAGGFLPVAICKLHNIHSVGCLASARAGEEETIGDILLNDVSRIVEKLAQQNGPTGTPSIAKDSKRY
jgi:hypothetical protein